VALKQQEAELDKELDRIVGLFSFLTDKDLFAEVYRSLLCKRLLGGKTQSSDLERSMISKLKLQCGTQFTSKLEGMMNDLVGQEKQEKEFREFQDAQASRPTVDFSVQVLTSGFWPTSVTMPIVLPPALAACTKQFGEWYTRTKTNRVLTWCHAQGTVSIRAAYGSGRSYEGRFVWGRPAHQAHTRVEYDTTERKHEGKTRWHGSSTTYGGQHDAAVRVLDGTHVRLGDIAGAD
jgi:cullin 1